MATGDITSPVWSGFWPIFNTVHHHRDNLIKSRSLRGRKDKSSRLMLSSQGSISQPGKQKRNKQTKSENPSGRFETGDEINEMQLRVGNLGNRGIRWVLFTLIYTRWVLFTLPNTNCPDPGSIARGEWDQGMQNAEGAKKQTIQITKKSYYLHKLTNTKCSPGSIARDADFTGTKTSLVHFAKIHFEVRSCLLIKCLMQHSARTKHKLPPRIDSTAVFLFVKMEMTSSSRSRMYQKSRRSRLLAGGPLSLLTLPFGCWGRLQKKRPLCDPCR